MRRPFGIKVVAFLIAALLPAVILAIPSLASPSPGVGLWAFVTAGEIGLAVAIVGGLPALILLSVLKAKKLRYYLLASLVLGAVLAALLLGPGILNAKTTAGWPSWAAQIVIVMVLSMLPGSIYWLIVRPDKEA